MNENELDDIKKLCKFFKEYISKPKNSNKAGEIYIMFKKLNDSIKKVKK